MRKDKMKEPTKEEIKKESEKLHKIYECYRYLVNNCNDEVLKKKIEALGREHLLSNSKELRYSVEISTKEKIRQLKEMLGEK